VCGGIFNQSYLASHGRLAHGKGKRSIAAEAGEDETIQTLVSLYEELSPEGRRQAMRLLAGKNRKKEGNE
jgi:mannose/fructose-specific phosphotransferase system component IIA